MAAEADSFVTHDSEEPTLTMSQVLQLLQQLNSSKTIPENTNPQPLSISEKLNNQNYTKWSRLMYLAISGRNRLSHITALPPPADTPEYQKRATVDSNVISWIVENIESDFQNQFLDYPTARELWKGIELMYSSGRDGLQIFDLMVKANALRQGSDSVEIIYSKLLTIWKEVDRRMPNPMKCTECMNIYNEMMQRTRLYQFLAAIHDGFDIKDMLNQDPLPTVEVAYATIRREVARRGIMNGDGPSSEENPSGIDSGLAARSRSENTKGAAKTSFRREDDKSHLRCTHCGGTRHTKTGCFKLIGYPEWWPDSKKRGKGGVAATTVSNQEAASTGGYEGFVGISVGAARSQTGEADEEDGLKIKGYSDGEDHWSWL